MVDESIQMWIMQPMNIVVPSTEDVRAGLAALSQAELVDLSSRSGVPFSTLSKIRYGHTPNPGLDTVRKFFHLLPAELAQQNTHPAQVEQGASHA